MTKIETALRPPEPDNPSLRISRLVPIAATMPAQSPEDSRPEDVVRNQITFTHIGKSALGHPTKLPPVVEHEAAYLSRIEQEREELLSMEQNTRGINLDRINAYREQMGAPSKPVLFLDSDKYEAALALAGSSINASTNDVFGVYLNNQDVVVVRRDPKLERLNGTAWVESMAIHEIAHSSAMMHSVRLEAEAPNLVDKSITVHAARNRSGLMVNRQSSEGTERLGSFLEEGYADYERGQYVKQLGNKKGVLVENPTLLEEPEVLQLGSHYFWMDMDQEKGGTRVMMPTRSSVPAMALEALIGEDPQLLDALRKSRYSVEGLREVAKRINALEPGLYKSLQAIDVYNEGNTMLTARATGELIKRLSSRNT